VFLRKLQPAAVTCVLLLVQVGGSSMLRTPDRNEERGGTKLFPADCYIAQVLLAANCTAVTTLVAALTCNNMTRRA
jgi:hypothetical protein